MTSSHSAVSLVAAPTFSTAPDNGIICPGPIVADPLKGAGVRSDPAATGPEAATLLVSSSSWTTWINTSLMSRRGTVPAVRPV